MKLTVGPHPPAVYWRRRAVVLTLGAGLLVSGVVTCRSVAAPTTTATRPSTAAPAAPTPTTATTAAAGQRPSASATPAATADTGTGPLQPDRPGTPTPIPSAPVCTDSDLTLTPVVTPDPGVYGGTFTFTLKIRNVSGHGCRRDVGSGAQELRVLHAGTVVWSSDDCDTPRESDVRSFGRNIETEFRVQWSSYRIRPDDCQPAATPAQPGSYQVVARLDDKLSAPTGFTIAV